MEELNKMDKLELIEEFQRLRVENADLSDKLDWAERGMSENAEDLRSAIQRVRDLQRTSDQLIDICQNLLTEEQLSVVLFGKTTVRSLLSTINAVTAERKFDIHNILVGD